MREDDRLLEVACKERLRCYRAAKQAVEDALFLDRFGDDAKGSHGGRYALEGRILKQLSIAFCDLADKRRRVLKTKQ